MADFKSYLAASILTEDKVVTYRLLSRVLKVHINTAKEMLFEFHRVQNAKKPGTIHATYLIGGTKRNEAPRDIEAQKDGEDDYMQSSPFVGSSMPQAEGSAGESSILSITLTREEDLETIRSQFEHISSIHIYSLGPHPLKELQLLSDSTREIQTLAKSEDPLETYHKYGIIPNPNVKRRTRSTPPIAAATQASVPTRPATAKSKLNEVQEASKSSSSSKKPESKSQPSNAKDFFASNGKEKAKAKSQEESTKAEPTTAPSSKESTPAPPANLKRESSSIFKAFAKTQPKKAKIEETESSAKDDTAMKDVSDDDEEDTWMPAPVSKETKSQDRNSRKETQERLRKMMEEDDEEEEAVPSPAPETPAEEVEEEKASEETKEEEPVASTSNGRRRGRRRVMKKRTVKDEDGYLVTKQEAAWESFSEDEPAPAPKAKAAPVSTKSKKEAPKKGQGNIMAFFGKK
ncbi:putative dna polymerase subunit cdc27 protein [Botrytis cinerea BcDW1]|uniref:DNA polymerase delta subunit 3 n=1 Tax=Botryotinia fuckeliana (strain BcDW1) TaxID=1290391 RepID=M7TKL5_BOTF1|nr:putative dna polymerase subunit cdc27 protein [Botrytis cinerea BcDW1]EMR88891.1 putative dna polymerase subunit cdc27 protein [Botrytis cinerea BcDW1]